VAIEGLEGTGGCWQGLGVRCPEEAGIDGIEPQPQADSEAAPHPHEQAWIPGSFPTRSPPTGPARASTARAMNRIRTRKVTTLSFMLGVSIRLARKIDQF